MRRPSRRRRRQFGLLFAPIVLFLLAVSTLVVHQGAALRRLHVVALVGGALLDRYLATELPSHSYNSTSSRYLLGEEVKNSNNDEDNEDKEDNTPTSPVASMLSNFPNRAIEQEVRRHDRYVVDSLAFLNKLDQQRVEQYASEPGTNGGATTNSNKPFTIVVLTSNRAVPYVTVPISMLLRGHEPKDFRDFMKVHVVNVERRPGKENYYIFDEMETKLSSIMTFHRWTEAYPKHQHILDPKNLYRADQKMDYIRSLELCQTTQSKWCIVLKDDAIPVDNLAGNLLQYVDRPTFSAKGRRYSEDKNTAKKAQSPQVNIAQNANTDQDGDLGGEILLQQVGMIKLHSPYNCNHIDNDRNLLREEYVEKQYDADAADANAGPSYGHRFSHISHSAVAAAFPSSTLAKVISYLRKQPNDGSIPFDEQLHHFWSSKANDLEVLEMSPSLVNHIGFVSDRRKANRFSKGISTDVRFRLTGGIEQRHSRTFSISDMMGQFSHDNEAVQREVKKHDRYLVDSLAHLNQFDESQAAKYIHKDTVDGKRFTFVVLTINRSLPYLAMFLSTLIRGHTTTDFAQLDVHVANIERRPGKGDYHLFEELKRKIPFATFHDWRAPYQKYENITDPKVAFFANQRVDYIRALRLCQSNHKEYCLVFEDDALPCVGLLKKFILYVGDDEYRVFGSRPNFIDPDKLRPGQQNIFKVVANPKPIDQKEEDAENVHREKVGVMKLFYNWNDGHTKWGLSKKYSKNDYPTDRILDMFEAKREGENVEETKHRVFFSRAGYGAVADAFHVTVVPKLIDFLERHDTDGSYPVDAQINHKFIAAFNFDRLVLSPSIVNHIGYMSEHANDAHLNTRRISTDVRFQLDDKSYWKSDEKNRATPTRLSISSSSIGNVNNGSKMKRGTIGGQLLKRGEK